MNNIKSCIYPIFFSGIGFIVYRSYRYNQDILNKKIISDKQKVLDKQKILDKFNAPDYNPFLPHKST